MTIKNVDRQYAEQLLTERRELVDRAGTDHQGGWHVGTDSDVTRCEECRRLGDMPRHFDHSDLPSVEQLAAFRTALLNRNIAEMVARMRLHADLVAFEREAIA